MPPKSKPVDGYKKVAEAIKAGQVGTFYIFHGEERYLLEHNLFAIRGYCCPDGLDAFNYKRFEGANVSFDDLEDAVNTLPAFAERTLLEVHDLDVFNSSMKPEICDLVSDLPEYICFVLVFDTVPFKPDGRVKTDKEILKYAEVIDFAVQRQDNLVQWIRRHFTNAGKSISNSDAEYLVLITGGEMSALINEIGKVTAYALGNIITRADIDAVVSPILDTVAYKLTDALVRREHAYAMRILDELLQMREAPHKLIYSISLKMRQLLAARVCIESKSGRNSLIEMCDIRHEFQAKLLLDTARKTTLKNCADAVLLCAQTAHELNSSPEPAARLTELIAKLAFV